MTFKDHFSHGSRDYQAFRPDYPRALFDFLATLVNQRQLAWDCATGSGQSAAILCEYFDHVIATDASENQIKNAVQAKNISYRVEKSEQSSLDPGSLDMITVSQALHWFDLEAFTGEVERVLKSGGVLAVWTYGLTEIIPAVDQVVNKLYGPMLDPYWPPERKIVIQGYANISFPFPEIQVPDFHMQKQWDLSGLLGYLGTWSAVKKFRDDRGFDPVRHLSAEFNQAWGDPEVALNVKWPLTLRAWRKA